MTFINIARVIFFVLLAIVTYLTVTPNPDDTKSGMQFTRWLATIFLGQEQLGDKVAHFIAYSTLGAFAIFSEIRIGGKASLTILLLAGYGMFLELVQGIGGIRSPEIADALANSLGVVCAWPIASLLMRLK